MDLVIALAIVPLFFVARAIVRVRQPRLAEPATEWVSVAVALWGLGTFFFSATGLLMATDDFFFRGSERWIVGVESGEGLALGMALIVAARRRFRVIGLPIAGWSLAHHLVLFVIHPGAPMQVFMIFGIVLTLAMAARAHIDGRRLRPAA